MKKIHLETVSGSALCGVNNASNYEERTLERSPRFKEVTCKRCIRRYLGYPINAKMDGFGGPSK